MALKGTLKDFPITDIFQLADQQGKSGILRLTNRDAEVRVLFDKGKVVGAESTTGKNREPLGRMLMRSGLIERDQLERALATQRKTLRKLGRILLDQKALEPDTLRQLLDLQTEETIYRLFLWRSGEYEFLSQTPTYDKDLATPMSAQHLLMDSLRMVDEWPGVRKRILGLDAVPDRVPEMEEHVVPAGASPGDENLDDDLDAAFSEWDGDEADSSDAGDAAKNRIQLTAGQSTVWDLIDGDRTVAEIADRALLGEFNTAKAVSELVEAGAVRIAGRRKAQADDTGRISALPANRSERLASGLWSLAVSAGILGAAILALILLVLGHAPGTIEAVSGPAPGRTLLGGLEIIRSAQTERAADVHWLLEGRHTDDRPGIRASWRGR